MQVISNKNHQRQDSQIKSHNGSIDACKECSGLVCCGIASEGGIVEPPFLTKYDIKKIEHFTGLRKKQFTKEKKNPNTETTINIMKTNNNEGCIFFDKDIGKCQIHSFRPMDCRLFPLDLEVEGKKYFLARYKYKKCNISKRDLYSLLEYSDEALQILGDELCNYATYPVPGMQKIGYKKLKQIKP